MTDAGADRSIRLVRILELPALTSAPPPPIPVDLTALVEFCEARLAQLNDRPGAEDARLAAKSRRRFTLAGCGMIGDVAMRIVREPIALDDLRQLASDQFGDFVKAVVDVRQGVMAIGGELHADEEALLIEQGAHPADLWGINVYPDRDPPERVELDAMINVRPAQGNRSRSVEDPGIQRRIQDLVARLVRP